MAQVAVIMGSKSDLGTLEGCFKILDDFGISYVKRVMSAHRTPAEAAEFASAAADNGFKVIICAAGMAAHLAGAVAANTVLPVIGIPVSCEPFNGFDALALLFKIRAYSYRPDKQKKHISLRNSISMSDYGSSDSSCYASKAPILHYNSWLYRLALDFCIRS